MSSHMTHTCCNSGQNIWDLSGFWCFLNIFEKNARNGGKYFVQYCTYAHVGDIDILHCDGMIQFIDWVKLEVIKVHESIESLSLR